MTALNELCGCQHLFQGVPTQEQLSCLEHLNSCIKNSDCPLPPEVLSPDAALVGLLHTSAVYTSDVDARSDLAPYDSALLSVPSSLDSMMVLAESLTAPGTRVISGSGEHVLRTDTSFKDIITRDAKIGPDLCPSLRTRSAYLSFASHLFFFGGYGGCWYVCQGVANFMFSEN